MDDELEKFLGRIKNGKIHQGEIWMGIAKNLGREEGKDDLNRTGKTLKIEKMSHGGLLLGMVKYVETKEKRILILS